MILGDLTLEYDISHVQRAARILAGRACGNRKYFPQSDAGSCIALIRVIDARICIIMMRVDPCICIMMGVDAAVVL